MYEHKLKYAGSDPFNKEIEREDISYEEMELLEQDETYRRLADLRYLAEAVQEDIQNDPLVERSNADDSLFTALGHRDAPIHAAVDRYVNQWLAEHRVEEVEA